MTKKGNGILLTSGLLALLKVITPTLDADGKEITFKYNAGGGIYHQLWAAKQSQEGLLDVCKDYNIFIANQKAIGGFQSPQTLTINFLGEGPYYFSIRCQYEKSNNSLFSDWSSEANIIIQPDKPDISSILPSNKDLWTRIGDIADLVNETIDNKDYVKISIDPAQSVDNNAKLIIPYTPIGINDLQFGAKNYMFKIPFINQSADDLTMTLTLTDIDLSQVNYQLLLPANTEGIAHLLLDEADNENDYYNVDFGSLKSNLDLTIDTSTLINPVDIFIGETIMREAGRFLTGNGTTGLINAVNIMDSKYNLNSSARNLYTTFGGKATRSTRTKYYIEIEGPVHPSKDGSELDITLSQYNQIDWSFNLSQDLYNKMSNENEIELKIMNGDLSASYIISYSDLKVGFNNGSFDLKTPNSSNGLNTETGNANKYQIKINTISAFSTKNTIEGVTEFNLEIK